MEDSYVMEGQTSNTFFNSIYLSHFIHVLPITIVLSHAHSTYYIRLSSMCYISFAFHPDSHVYLPSCLINLTINLKIVQNSYSATCPSFYINQISLFISFTWWSQKYWRNWLCFIFFEFEKEKSIMNLRSSVASRLPGSSASTSGHTGHLSLATTCHKKAYQSLLMPDTFMGHCSGQQYPPPPMLLPEPLAVHQ